MKPAKLAGSIAAVVAAASSLAFAGDELTSLSYISYLERYATVQPANGQQAVDAVVNMPLVTGDRIDTARGARLEVQLADGSTLWVDEFTTLDLDALAASREDPAPRTVLFMQEGTSALEIPAAAFGDDTVRFDYPGGTLFLSKPGFYRFDLRSGALKVQAHAGLAELPAGIASELLRAGQEAHLDNGGVRTSAIPAQLDDFWSWVQERRAPAPAARTSEIVGSTTAGRAAALDSYGTWVYVDTYATWAWRPYVQVGWTPYSHGRWYWTSVGWNWISYEPWGWYPYHYGSWYWDASFGWGWCWDMVWGPAWVHWMYTPGYIGWCPRGYYDYWYYGHGYHHGGYPGGYPGGHPGGAGRPVPARWGENALDFSGNVRLRDVDPRPWNMVPANQFTNSRLERVRVEPGRVLAEAGEDARAHVRSGQLVTAPSRGSVERDLAGELRGGGRGTGGSAGGSDELGGIFRRDDSSVRAIPGSSTVRTVRTADLVKAAPRRGEADAATGGETAARPASSSPGDRPMLDLSGSPRSARGSGGTSSPAAAGAPAATGSSRGAGDTAGTAPAGAGGSTGSTRSADPAGRDRSAAPRSATPPRTVEPGTGGSSSTAPRPREVQSAPRSGPAPAAPSSPSGGSAPAAAAPRSSAPAAEPSTPPARRPGYAARVRSLDETLAAVAGGQYSQRLGTTSTGTRTYVVPFEGGRRVFQVTSPGASSSAGPSTTGGASAGSGVARERSYTPRASQAPAEPAAAGSAAGGGSRAAPAGGAPAARSYQPAPSGSSAQRSYSAPSGGSAPRSYSGPSSGGSAPRAAAPSSAGSSRSTGGHSSGGARPSGRR